MQPQNPKRIGFAGIIDSPHRCPFDGKRMVMEPATKADGEEATRHECWHCGYTRYDTASVDTEAVREGLGN